MSSPSVLIVGAGPVGLAMALALHQGGIPASDILIADQRPSRDLVHTWSKALSTSASSLEVFRTLGIAERFIDAGTAINVTHFGGLSRLLDLNHDVLGTKYSFNMIIRQTSVETILLQRCEEVGIRFAWGRHFVGLTQTAGAVSATFSLSGGETDAEAETIQTPWLIGCDGTGSAVRKAAGIPFDGTRSTRHAWVAECHADQDAPLGKSVRSPDGATAMFLAHGPVKTVRRLIGCFPPSEQNPGGIGGGQRLAAPDLDYVRAWSERNFGDHYNLRDLTWSSVVGDGMRIAAGYRSGRVFVAGDAAHQLFPAGGQGMNTGFLDATNLGWKLARVVTNGKAGAAGTGGGEVVVERLLNSYGEERRAAALAVRHNVQMQCLGLFATTERDKAVADFMTEALNEPALNQLWARRVCGFGDPVEPYQLSYVGLGEGEELVGTRLTHISDENADKILDAANHNIFVVGLIAGSAFAEDQRNSLEQAVELCGCPDKVRVLGNLLSPTNAKWKGVTAVLIRPDLRILWVTREGSEIKVTQEAFMKVIEWWVGGK